jgi:hypothetical protein
MIVDPYLFLYLLSFLPLRDSVCLVQTSRQYSMDPLITDEMRKRLYDTTAISVVSFTNSTNARLSCVSNFQTDTCLTFLMPQIQLYEIPLVSSDIRIYIRTPGWDYEWFGNPRNMIRYNDVDNTDCEYMVTKSVFGSIDMVLYSNGDHIFIRDIRFKYNRNIKRLMRKLYWKHLAYQVSALTATVYIAYCEKLAGRIATMVVALLTAIYISDGIENNVRLTPQPNNI